MTLLAYPVIGGPLAGEYATAYDWTGESRFLGGGLPEGEGPLAPYASEYTLFEAPSIRGPFAAGDFPPKRVYVHQSLLKPTKRASER